MQEIINFLGGLIGTYLLVPILLGAGIYFTIRLGFIQFTHFGHTFKVMKGSRGSKKNEISSFQAFSTSLAARVGTGNLAGVAVAITAGGAGAVFWMWVVAILGMATSFAESTLAQAFKTIDKDGNFRGGPAYYMEKGLNMRFLGVLFSIAMIITFGLAFNGVQGNAIASALNGAFSIPSWLTGVVVALLAASIIFGGIKKISRFAEIVVPFMALSYLAVAIIVLILKIDMILPAIKLIFTSAFGLGEAAGGAMGAAISMGVKRGLFSNEAGMGSAPNAAATATPYPPHPASQGYVQMLGVFIDTILICTATATIILLSGVLETNQNLDGILLTQAALVSEVGNWGGIFIAVVIFFFAFTSIVANYSYAEGNLIFLEKKNTKGLIVLRIASLVMVFLGAILPLNAVFSFADLTMSVMALFNIFALVLLTPIVIKLAKSYNLQLKAGKVPNFVAKKEDISDKIESSIWK